VKYKILIRAEAEDDLREAFLWYEDKRFGLGYDFLLQIEVGLKFIERNPKVHQVEYKGTREHFVKRFPYKIIYFLENNKIVILAVIHSKRNPLLLQKRIKNR